MEFGGLDHEVPEIGIKIQHLNVARNRTVVREAQMKTNGRFVAHAEIGRASITVVTRAASRRLVATRAATTAGAPSSARATSVALATCSRTTTATGHFASSATALPFESGAVQDDFDRD